MSEAIHRLAGFRRRVRLPERVGGLPFAIALVAYAVAFAVMRPHATGDEPHYLLAAQSLVRDGDFDLRNDYSSAERVLAVHNWFPLDSHATASGYPGHNVGLSVFLAPAFWLGGTLASRALVITAAALLAHQLYRLLERLDPVPLQARRLAWAGIVLTLPLVAYSNQFYAEMLGALLTLVAVRVLVARRRTTRAFLLAGLSAAALPWLHVRFLPIAVCLVLALGLSELGREVGGWRFGRAALGRAVRRRARPFALLVAPLGTSLALIALFHQRWYGSPSPGAPVSAKNEGLSVGAGGWDFWLEDAVGLLLLNPAAGLLPTAPVYGLAIAATGCFVRLYGRKGFVAAVLVLGYVVLVASVGIPGAGSSFPGRFLVVVAPLAAVPLAVVIARVRLARVAYLVLLALSITLTGLGLARHHLLYPAADAGHTSLPVLRSVQPIFPNTLQNAAARESTAAAGGSPGFVLYATSTVRGGSYEATFHPEGGDPRTDAVARLEVVPPWGALATGTLLREPIVLTPFAARGGPGAFGVSIKPTTLEPDPRVRDWPLVLLWLVVLLLTGWLLLERLGRSPRLLDDLDLSGVALGLVPIGLVAIAVALWPGLIGVAGHPSFGWRQTALVAFGGSAVLVGLTIAAADWRRHQNARRRPHERLD